MYLISIVTNFVAMLRVSKLVDFTVTTCALSQKQLSPINYKSHYYQASWPRSMILSLTINNLLCPSNPIKKTTETNAKDK